MSSILCDINEINVPFELHVK